MDLSLALSIYKRLRMQLNYIRKGPAFGSLLTIALLFCADVATASGSGASLKAVVEAVYRQYAWVSVFSAELTSQMTGIEKESIGTLREIFVADLAEAIHQDANCARRTREVCAIDFSILFAAQDPQAIDLTITGEASGDVTVCFKDLQLRPKCLRYVGAFENGKTKIADIVYGDERSLRRLLQCQELIVE